MNWIVEQFAKPILRRAGTAVAGYLLAQAVPADTVETIVNGLTAAALVSADLMLSYKNRKDPQ